jgi:hypothetical protein
MANLFVEEFKAHSSDEEVSQDIIDTRKNTVFEELSLIKANKDKKYDNTTLNVDFVLKELTSAIDCCANNSSPGPDNIPFTFFKHLPSNSLEYLLSIYNQSFRTGTISENLKKSYVIPILKPNKDSTSVGSYRPISLTSTVSKIMEKILHTRISNYMNINQLFNINQSGFRKDHSTIDHIIRLKVEAQNAVNSGHVTMVILLDFTRAFDMLWIDGLLLKMIKLNITGNSLKWIQAFLTNRINQVLISNTLSREYSPENGTPQGSIISPLLFLIMINDFPKLSKFTSSALFADDGTIWRSGTNLAQITKHLQDDLILIEKWCKK